MLQLDEHLVLRRSSERPRSTVSNIDTERTFTCSSSTWTCAETTSFRDGAVNSRMRSCTSAQRTSLGISKTVCWGSTATVVIIEDTKMLCEPCALAEDSRPCLRSTQSPAKWPKLVAKCMSDLSKKLM